jgi:hypothetical protein
MPYSLQSAATACGVNRSTILRAIKSGRISATKDELGAWVLEPVEVHRVYPLVAVDGANAVALPDAATDALVAELRDQLAEMRAQRDAWQGISERIALGNAQPNGGKPCRNCTLFTVALAADDRLRMAAMLIKRVDFN